MALKEDAIPAFKRKGFGKQAEAVMQAVADTAQRSEEALTGVKERNPIIDQVFELYASAESGSDELMRAIVGLDRFLEQMPQEAEFAFRVEWFNAHKRRCQDFDIVESALLEDEVAVFRHGNNEQIGVYEFTVFGFGGGDQ